MDNIILGLLSLTNLTIYDLKITFQKGIYFMYSSSTGSLQAALRKLIGNGLITFSENVENGKNKKVYSITENGRNYFINWLSTPMNSPKLNNMELGKLFFMGMLPENTRIELIAEYIKNLQTKLSIVLEIKNQAMSVKFDNDKADIAMFQLSTIDFSIDSIRFEIEWYQSFYKKLEERGK